MKRLPKLIYCVFPINFFISHRLPIAREAIKKGYEVHLISTKGEGEEILTKEGIFFHPVQITRSRKNPIQEIKSIYQIYKIYKKINPDIVHHVTIKPVLYGTLAARMAGVKAVVNAFSGLGYVFTAKGVKAAILRNVIKLAYRAILRHNNLISIIQNEDDRDYLISKTIIRKNQARLIKGSGVDLSIFKPTVEPSGIPVVILPARLLKDKGVIEFVEAAKQLKRLNFKVRMVLVGDVDMGNPSSVSVGEIKEWVDDGYVEHWGFKNNMAKTLSEANIVCLPSYREGMPKSLIEATASSRVIITTDVPGCREMIDKNNPNGILIPAGSSIALSDAIIDILSDKKKRQIMAFNGRKMAEKEFSINQVVKSTLKIYEDLLN